MNFHTFPAVLFISRRSSCLLFPLLLSAPMVQGYCALCRLKASGCLVELWKATSYLFFRLVFKQSTAHMDLLHIYAIHVFMYSYVGEFEKNVLVDLLLPFPWNTRQT